MAAQGLAAPRPLATPDIRHLRRAIRTPGLLQLDFVNVLAPAHRLVVFSRVGPYDPERLQRLVYERGEFTEQWAHEASIVPMDAWPLLGHRREAFRPWPKAPIMQVRNRDRYLRQVLKIVEEKGPVTAADLPPVAGPRRRPGDWHRSVPRWALEVQFGRGRLAVASRLPNFQRVYDLPERVIPVEQLKRRLTPADARRELLARASAALGVATAPDLADYYRMPARDALPRIRELVEAGEIEEVRVEGWNEPAYLAGSARIPRSLRARTLLSPFDPLVWHRPRVERLFDFHYRIEIYVPAARRRWGYYVLPFLHGDRIVARVDLKAERGAGRLLVKAAHLEAHANEGETAAALASELRQVADWLGLGRIRVGRRGGLSPALRRAVRSAV